MTPFPAHRIYRKSILGAFLASTLLTAGCDDEGREEKSGEPAPVVSAPTDAVSKKIEAFTGAHTKMVWARYTGGGSDVFANFDKLELWGIDTRDGKGVRPILQETSNYARPLVLPDGSGVLFSNKQTKRKPSGNRAFDPLIYRVDWDGENLTEIGPGYAVDAWIDPESGETWIYATDLRPTDRSSIDANKLERFPLSDPEKRETIWDQTRIGTENVHLSRDGRRTSCLFPWPHAGVLNFETMRHQKYQHGCWPSMAPDNSYHAWVFDGAHKNLHFFTDGAAETWVVPVNTAPGTDGHEVYHPRWSNHVRFFAMTGPYTGQTVVRSDSGEVEVYVGKFSDDLKTVEDWLQVTDDTSGDVFPDLWVAGGENVELAAASGDPSTAPESTAGKDENWPAAEGPHFFSWKNRDTTNRVGNEDSRESSVAAKERARFGPHFEMLTDGGYFVPDDTSTQAVLEYGDGKPFTVEAVITPAMTEQSGDVIFTSAFALRQEGEQLTFGLAGQALEGIGTVKAGTATHVAIRFDGQEIAVFRDGKAVTPAPVDASRAGVSANTPGAKVPLGFGHGWDGALERVALSPAAATTEAIAASASDWKATLEQREAIPTIRVRAKLVEMTESRPVEALDTYLRGLLGYLYEVEEVLEGEFEGEKVMVMHWTILDRTLLSGFPREVGGTYELRLQPYASHPELVSERQWNDLFDPSEPWFDVSTPEK